jgi:hypothetical protein
MDDGDTLEFNVDCMGIKGGNAACITELSNRD